MPLGIEGKIPVSSRPRGSVVRAGAYCPRFLKFRHVEKASARPSGIICIKYSGIHGGARGADFFSRFPTKVSIGRGLRITHADNMPMFQNPHFSRIITSLPALHYLGIFANLGTPKDW